MIFDHIFCENFGEAVQLGDILVEGKAFAFEIEEYIGVVDHVLFEEVKGMKIIGNLIGDLVEVSISHFLEIVGMADKELGKSVRVVKVGHLNLMLMNKFSSHIFFPSISSSINHLVMLPFPNSHEFAI